MTSRPLANYVKSYYETRGYLGIHGGRIQGNPSNTTNIDTTNWVPDDPNQHVINHVNIDAQSDVLLGIADVFP